MKIDVVEIGAEASRVVVIEDLVPDPGRVVDIAAGLAPFPEETSSFYPGRRRDIMRGPAFGYVDWVCRTLGPVLPQIFAIESFQIKEAAFSVVTREADALSALQSIPHFDNSNPKAFAILHYLSKVSLGGTGFYRQRSTGFEKITETRVEPFRQALETDYAASQGPPRGYFSGSTSVFEETARFEAVYNRALIYQGCLLHSGLLPETFNFSPDPLEGRLTGNIFVAAQ